MTPAANWYFMAASAVLLTVVGTLVTERLVAPRLGEYRGPAVAEPVNRHGERESIRNIRKTLGVLPLKGPWSERMVRAAGRELTLDEVEHEIVRKEFREPRIHFALVCAALSCPPLRREAYVGARLDAQLEEQARSSCVRPTRTAWTQPAAPSS